ncbi:MULTISPECIES: cold-shock protein [unclassified Flammeovirga]|uniref:cold-shock protein n=1 Tax=unclassified Flammeovirga TaxID=2637820 RepID=UPI0005C46809|nr:MULTISPECIES: cold shock domain-containing protein [unclassified Flammeovirga]KXX71706.1 cold-shock protein [Flammeovirga sp. SJP92]MBD0403653.1 cold shock domain-containing protein [Flammeovirga sp. EKP202]
MKQGTVKFFNATKGFGFIVDSETNNEIFVHISGCIDEIKENDQVQFEVEEGRRGLNAVNVQLS